MAKKRSPRVLPSRGVTADRAQRLYRLLQLLGRGPQTRAVILRQLGLDVRTFYRDLEVLREAGLAVVLEERRYVLREGLDRAMNRLPFPDPQLTLGEAQQLARGRSAAHRKLQERIQEIVPPPGPR